MIADLRYAAEVPSDAVSVRIYWDDGQPVGSIDVPPKLQNWIEAENLPSLEPLPVTSAIAYAIVLASRIDADLVVTGDPSAWLSKWGKLISTPTRWSDFCLAT
jgi:hypothetical protein